MQPDSNEQEFWMVWNGSPGGSAPTRKHATAADAMAEAMRLARVNPRSEFYVLHAVRKYVADIDVKPVELTVKFP